MGQSGCVASETTKVCCNVERAVLSSWDTLGKAPDSEADDSSDDLLDILLRSTSLETLKLMPSSPVSGLTAHSAVLSTIFAESWNSIHLLLLPLRLPSWGFDEEDEDDEKEEKSISVNSKDIEKKKDKKK